MMQLIDFLLNYAPYDDAEEGAVRSFRQFLQAFGDKAYSRDNLIGHLCASSWIVNRERNKVLMVYHNLYDSWSWTGGHADGCMNLPVVALREAREETGLERAVFLREEPLDLNVLSVYNHVKRGVFVPTHLHFNVVYLLEADEKEALRCKSDENSGVKWIDFEQVQSYCGEKEILPYYKRIMEKIGKMKK